MTVEGRDPMAEERMDPATADTASFWEHAYRYGFASAYVRDKRVLDIACGEGYGTDALREAGARSVVGIDLSCTTCAGARRKYGQLFCAGDAQAIPLADRSVDVVVSFETIEHIERPALFLDECVRVLAPRGVLILSTPNRKVHGESPHRNPFHLSEMDEPEILYLLASRFRRTRRYAQIPKTAPWWSPRTLAATDAWWIRLRGGWRVREWVRSLLCPHIVRRLDEGDRRSPVRAALTRDRLLASWVNPYRVYPRWKSGKDRPWYLVAVAHDRSDARGWKKGRPRAMMTPRSHRLSLLGTGKS